MELFQQYQTYIFIALALVALIVWYKTSREGFNSFVEFLKSAFTETGGKTSYSRILGTVVTIKILSIQAEPPESWMNIFMIFVGYQLIAGILKDNPMIMEYFKMRMNIGKEAPKGDTQQ